MKKLVLIFISSVFVSQMYSQNWAPVGSKWYYSQATINPNLQIYITIESIGDTLFQNRSCRILKEIIYMPPYTANTIIMYSSNDSVFYYDEALTDFCLLYFFNAQPGDTVHLDCFDLDCIIDSVKTIDFNGQAKIVQYLTTESMGFNMFDRNIEGIGNSIFMFPVVENYTSGPLRCFEDSLGLISFSSLECDTVINTEIARSSFAQDFKIFTDDVNSKIILELPDYYYESTLVNVYSGLGLKIMSIKNSNNKQVEISTDKLSPGIYFVELLNDKKQSLTRKVMVK